jgi:hypothetical protein
MPTNNSLTNTLPIVRKPRVMHDKAHWRDLISEYEGSSLTQQAFCQQHKISTSSLHKWRKRFSTISSATDFIEISEAVTPPNLSRNKSGESHLSWLVELELGQGIVLRVKGA